VGTGIYKATFTPNADGKWLLEVKHATYFATGRRWVCRYYAAPSWAGGNAGVTAADANADGEVEVSWNSATLNAALTALYAVDYRLSAGPGAWVEFGRTTATSLRVGALTDAAYDFRVRVYCMENGVTTTGADTASATPTWATAVAAPTILSATDDGTGTSFTLQLQAADEANNLFARYRRSSESAWTTFPTPRAGSGALQVTGVGLYRYEVQVHECGYAALTEEFSLPSASAFVTVSAGAPEAAAGRVSLPLEAVRTLVASSATFQAQVGADSAETAKACIHIGAVRPEFCGTSLALISHAGGRDGAVAAGAAYSFARSGDAEVQVEFELPAEYRHEGQDLAEDAYLWFANRLGAIVMEMQALAGAPGYLDARSIEIGEIERTCFEDEARGTRFLRAALRVGWGS
jgi:hypothetical protein